MTRQVWLTHEDFAHRVGETFDLTAPEGAGQVLELVEVTHSDELGGQGPEGQTRLQFSLLFVGPASQPLPQKTYALTHPEMGELDLFLVPLGPGALGMRYESAFA